MHSTMLNTMNSTIAPATIKAQVSNCMQQSEYNTPQHLKYHAKPPFGHAVPTQNFAESVAPVRGIIAVMSAPIHSITDAIPVVLSFHR